MALGVSEATLLEMTGAYAGILNGGVRVRPYGLTELRRKSDGAPLDAAAAPAPAPGCSTSAPRASSSGCSSQVVDHGTGARAQLPDGRPAAGKTGTTQAARDAWFIGFTADYVTGVWMGYDDNTPLSGTTGGGLPAEIWREVMTRVEDGLPVRPLPDRMPAPPVASAPQLPNPVAAVDTAVRTVVQNVLQGLFGRN